MTIDWWTLGIQGVNIVILIWLLGRFFWRPVAAMIEQRRTAAQQLLAEAESKRSQAAEALAAIEQTRAGFEKEREAILAAAHVAAGQACASLLVSAEAQASALQAAATTAIAEERQSVEKEWRERSSRLAVDIAQRLLTRLDGPAVSATFLDWLLREIRVLPAAVRDAAAADGAVLEAVSATPIDPGDQPRYRQSIGEALGSHPAITFRVDPALIAGLELHGPHLVIANSWSADLTRIKADLAHDQAT